MNIITKVGHKLRDNGLEIMATRYIAEFMSGIPVLDLARLAVHGEDLSVFLPELSPEALAIIPPQAVTWLQQLDVGDFESIRVRLSYILPDHADLLGMQDNQSWFVANMDRIRSKLITQFSGG